MKKLFTLTLVSSSLLMSQAYAVCVNSNADIPPASDDTNKIHLSDASVNGTVYNLDIKAWKFDCPASANVGLALSVENIGNKATDFNRNNLSYAGSGITTIQPGGKIYSVTEDDANKTFQNTDTPVKFMFFTTIVGPYQRSGTAANSATLSATAGLWYDPSLSGTGFNFIDTPNGMLAYYYGYDKDGGKNWLMATKFGPKAGEANVGKEYVITLNEPADNNGGLFSKKPTGSTSGTVEWGTMAIKFSDCNKATAVLDGVDGKQIFNLTKLVSNAGSVCTIQTK